MVTPAQSAQIAHILDTANDLTLAVNGEDGYPHAVSLTFAHEGLAIYVGTSASSLKVRCLARDDRVSLTVNKPYAGWKNIEGLAIAGRAHRVTSPEEFFKAVTLLFAKYPEAAGAAPQSGEDVAVIRIDPEAITLLDYTKGHGHREFITV